MKRFLIIILPIFLFLGCNKPEQKVKPHVPVIDFELSRTTKDYQLSDIAKRIEYIELEANKESFIGEINRINFINDKIIILDRTLQKILLFSFDGKFIRTIGKRGKGPGEYTRLYDLDVNETNEEIYVYCFNDIIQIYSFNNRFIRSLHTSSIKMLNFKVSERHIVFTIAYPLSILFGNHSFGIMDFQGNITKRLLYRNLQQKEMPKNIVCNSSFYSINDTIVFWEYIYDTIYCISPDYSLVPRWVLNYGKNAVRPEAFQDIESLNNSKRSGKLIITSLFESNSHLYFTAIENLKRQFIIYDKRGGALFKLPSQIGILTGIFNNLDNGASFWPNFTINDSTIGSILDPIDLHLLSQNTEITSKLKSPHFKEIINRISIQSNPVIMKITTK